MTTEDRSADIVIVGGTPGGVMTAVAAARRDASVLLLERTAHVGGLPANGLGATDIATRGATGGLFQTFIDRVYGHYVDTYGEDSQQVADSSDGYHFEPSVAETVFETLLDEAGVTVARNHQFDAAPANVERDSDGPTAIAVTDRETGDRYSVTGRVFVDATYEGDLAAAAGVPYRVGREGVDEFDEPFAGKVYKYVGGPTGSGSTGEADNAVQSYNYRVCLTDDPDNRIPIEQPDDYDRSEYASLVEDVTEDRNSDVDPEYELTGMRRVVLQTTLPNGKTDTNNHGRAFLSTDLPEENWPWPTAGWDWRDRFAERLRDYTLGLLWFMQHDPELPESFKAQTRPWGLAADEYEDNDHFPRQVYVREGRRVEGEHFFTAHDARPRGPETRPPIYPTSVTASHYAIDSHATRKREPGKVNLEGFLSGIRSEPYTVPYGVMVPRGVDRLLTPVPVSGTHLGFSTLRMEPCWMALGHAAGIAATMALKNDKPLCELSVARLQRELLADEAILYHFTDLAPGDPHYEALQFLGVRGFVPGWEARANEPISEETVAEWRAWSGLQDPPAYDWGETTRGEYADRLYTALLERPDDELEAIQTPAAASPRSNLPDQSPR